MKKITAFLLTLLALVFVFPVLFLAVGSLMGKNELTDLLLPVLKTGSTGYASWKLFPEYPTLRSYVEVLLDSPEFFVMFWNSVKITLGALAGELLVGMPAAWGFAKFDFPGKNIMFALLMVAMMVPIQVTIVALYKIMTMLGVINTSWAVTLPSIFGASCPGLAGAFGVFMMRQFFMGVPKELNEAAAIDGAGPIRTFISIMLPMAKSTLASLAIIVFTYSWNDYFTTFIMINDTEKLTLPVGILSIKQPFSTGDNVVFAAVVLAILPVLIVFLIGQKWIVKSMTHVGVKG